MFARLSFTIGCAIFVMIFGLTAHAQPIEPSRASVPVASVVPGITAMSLPMKSLRDMRYQNMVRQKQDFTCGAAALATILQYMFGKEITEQEIIHNMLANTDPKIVQERGFSLLDMKNYVERIGLRGRGYRIDGTTLHTLKIPVIALQTTRGFAHFVVVKRVHGGMVYIADPALGHRQLPIDEFTAAWNGIVFAVLGKGLRKENVLVQSAKSLVAPQRAGIITRTLPPQQEFGLLGMDTF